MRRLATFFRSSTSYRLRITLALKGLDWQPSYVSLPRMEHRAGAYLALNPQGLLPTLVEADGTVLTQSLAIMEYLNEVYPEPPLLPANPVERAYVRALAQIVGCDIHPLNNVRVLRYLGSRWQLSENDTNEWYAHWIAEGFRALESMLARERRFGRFCIGDQVTMADVCLVPQIANARRFACDLSDYPRCVAIGDAAAELPAFKTAQPAQQADAF
jgi:maleylacetoacetate isomerase